MKKRTFESCRVQFTVEFIVIRLREVCRLFCPRWFRIIHLVLHLNRNPFYLSIFIFFTTWIVDILCFRSEYNGVWQEFTVLIQNSLDARFL